MFALSRSRQILQVSMIVLALLASLPGAVCCCGLPQGLHGLLNRHDVRETKSVAQQSCTCCAKDKCPSSEDSANFAANCECRIFLTAPSPMVAAPAFNLDFIAPIATLGFAESPAVSMEGRPLIESVTERRACCHSALYNCARMQSWQV